jgi:hypothetical protein
MFACAQIFLDVSRSRNSVTVTRREKKISCPEALARRNCPLPLDPNHILRQFRVIRILLNALLAKRDLQNWHLLIVDSHSKVADPYRTVEHSPDTHVTIVWVMDENTGAGLKALQQPAPTTASACGDVTQIAGIIPGTTLVMTEHHVVVATVPLTWRPLGLLRASPFLSGFRIL